LKKLFYCYLNIFVPLPKMSRKNSRSKLRIKAESPIPLVDWENQASPFYTAHHKRYRDYLGKFVDLELLPHIEKWEKQGNIPMEFYKTLVKYGLYAQFYPKQFGGTPFEGKHMDAFHEIIWYEQMCRAGSSGVLTSTTVHRIAVPPVLAFGTEEQKELCRSILTCDKLSALAISEPRAGSDVRSIYTNAVLDDAGENYIVNGEKYWITGGTKADWFTTAVRTGGPGRKGISLLLIPRSKGVITSRLPLQGHNSSATAYVVFRDCKVPKKYLIGKENEGFKLIMFNFNSERFGIAASAVCFARLCIEESVRYAKTRKTFGKALIDHQVIRHKIANMSREVMSVYGFMCLVAYALSRDPLGLKDRTIARNVSLFKVQATRCLEFCAREASQIFGGRSYVRGGRGGKIERIYRDVRAMAIYGGSEEIMLDLAIRQAKL